MSQDSDGNEWLIVIPASVVLELAPYIKQGKQPHMDQAYLTCLQRGGKGDGNTEVDFCSVQVWCLQERNLEAESSQTY